VSPANPTGPTGGPASVAQQLDPPLFPPSPADRKGPCVSRLTPLLLISYLLPASDASTPGDPRRNRARGGWDARPARRACTPRGRCAHARGSNLARGGFSTFAPSHRAPATWLARGEPAPPRPPGQSSQDSLGLSPRRSRPRDSKAGRGRNPSAPTTNPFGVFLPTPETTP
jgi:hypothetical protein